MSIDLPKGTRSKRGEPTWEVAQFFPAQGDWSEEEYLDLDTNHYVELTDGCLEFLPLVTMSHQGIVGPLCLAVKDFVDQHKLGKAIFGPLPVRLRVGMLRQPDVIVMLAEHASRLGEEYWGCPDLVMEVVSPGGRHRDLRRKRLEYAAAGISEYWIVDPKLERITVLRLEGNHYAVHGEFKPGERASSALLSGFTVDVAAALAAK